MEALKDHEIASIFPLLPESELEALAADIKANGLREPIVLHEGKILDGRNRYRACKIAGVEPRVEQHRANGSLVEFVFSMNYHRRHLTQSQKATSATEALPWFEKEAKERQRQHAGTAPGKGRNTGGKNATSDSGKARDKAAKEQPRTETGFGEKPGGATECSTTCRHKSEQAKSAASATPARCWRRWRRTRVLVQVKRGRTMLPR